MSAIKYPKNHDLRELISFSAETGHIWLAESRMLMLHVAAMAALRHELINLVGVEHARNLLTRVGYVSGMNDAEIARKIRDTAHPVDAFVVGPQLHMLEGSVQVTPVSMDFDLTSGRFYGEFFMDAFVGGRKPRQNPRPSRRPRVLDANRLCFRLYLGVYGAVHLV